MLCISKPRKRKETMAKATQAQVPVKNTPPVVETDIKRKPGRPRKEALTVEQEIIALHNLIKKFASRMDAIEEMVLQVEDEQDKPITIKTTATGSNSDLD